MKKQLFCLMIMSLTMGVNAEAVILDEAVKINGIYYYLLDNQAKVAMSADRYSGKVVIPESVTYDGVNYSVTSIEEMAFLSCRELTSITIPKSVKTIGWRAFYECISLTTVSISNGVETIGDHAFEGCSSLTSVTIPNSVKSIGEYAFGGCSSLTSIVVKVGNKTYDSRNNCNAIIDTESNNLIKGCKNTIIPNSVKYIGDYAFENSGLTSITIPNSVTSIGEEAFKECI